MQRTRATLLAAALTLATVMITPTPAHAQNQRPFAVTTTGASATGTITWSGSSGSIEGTVRDTVKDGASGVVKAHVRTVEVQGERCVPPPPSDPTICTPVYEPVVREVIIAKVSSGVGTSAPIQRWETEFPEGARGTGLWARVCRTDFSADLQRQCSGLG